MENESCKVRREWNGLEEHLPAIDGGDKIID